jgi:hypothetical protein
MKKSKFLSFVLLIILTISLPTKIFATGYFLTYLGNVSWTTERVYLGNLAIELKSESDLIGYIAFQIGSKDNRKKINTRIVRMKKYLTSKYGINSSRIVFVVSEKPSPGKETFIILQPVSKNIPQSIF